MWDRTARRRPHLPFSNAPIRGKDTSSRADLLLQPAVFILQILEILVILEQLRERLLHIGEALLKPKNFLVCFNAA